MNITIDMDDNDFDALWSTAMQWTRYNEDWRGQAADRFRTLVMESINYDYRWAHWFDDAASMILARSYLASLKEDHQVLADKAGGYVILTNWESPSVRER